MNQIGRSKSTIDDFRSHNKESTIFSFTENLPSLKVKKLNGNQVGQFQNNFDLLDNQKIEFNNSIIQNGLKRT